VLHSEVWCPKLKAVKFNTGVRYGTDIRPYIAVSEDIAGYTRAFRKF